MLRALTVSGSSKSVSPHTRSRQCNSSVTSRSSNRSKHDWFAKEGKFKSGIVEVDTGAPETWKDTGDFIITEESPGGVGLQQDPIDLIAKVPPIEVPGKLAHCDGGDQTIVWSDHH